MEERHLDHRLQELREIVDDAYEAARRHVYDRLPPGQSVKSAQLTLDQVRVLRRLSDAEAALTEYRRSLHPSVGD